MDKVKIIRVFLIGFLIS